MHAVQSHTQTRAKLSTCPALLRPYCSMFLHKIDLSQDSDSSGTLGVDITGKTKTVRVGEIDIGGSDCQNDGVGLGDVLHNHVPDLLFNILGLVSNGQLMAVNSETGMVVSVQSEMKYDAYNCPVGIVLYLSQAGQVDKGQRQDMRGVDAEVDRKRRDSYRQPTEREHNTRLQ